MLRIYLLNFLVLDLGISTTLHNDNPLSLGGSQNESLTLAPFRLSVSVIAVFIAPLFGAPTVPKLACNVVVICSKLGITTEPAEPAEPLEILGINSSGILPSAIIFLKIDNPPGIPSSLDKLLFIFSNMLFLRLGFPYACCNSSLSFWTSSRS